MKKTLLIALSLILIVSPTANAASNQDKALALAVTGCRGGLFTPYDKAIIKADLYAEFILFYLWSDPEKYTDLMLVHLEAMSQGFSAAASLDSKYRILQNKYEDLYSYLETQLYSGKKYYTIQQAGTVRYGNSIFASCKVFLAQAEAKSKKSNKTLLVWIRHNAGDLLPRLDIRN